MDAQRVFVENKLLPAWESMDIDFLDVPASADGAIAQVISSLSPHRLATMQQLYHQLNSLQEVSGHSQQSLTHDAIVALMATGIDESITTPQQLHEWIMSHGEVLDQL